MAFFMNRVLAVIVLLHAAEGSKMFPDCVEGTQKVYMPSAESGNCFCGGNAPKMCEPFPEYLGLNRALCKRESSDIEVGSVSGTGMICGFFCMCENATVVDGNLDNVKCCRAGTKFGLKNNTVIARDSASTTRPLRAEDFLPMPAGAPTSTAVACLTLLLAAVLP